MANLHQRGMSSNPFAGCTRLDKLEMIAFASGSDSGYKILALEVTRQAAHEYLYFGLGSNYITAQQFIDSANWILNVRSYDPDSWIADRECKQLTVNDDGCKQYVTVSLTCVEMGLCCVDQWFSLTGIQMPLDSFVDAVRARRKQIVTENSAQIAQHLGVVMTDAVIDMLTDPRSEDQLAKALEANQIDLEVAA